MVFNVLARIQRVIPSRHLCNLHATRPAKSRDLGGERSASALSTLITVCGLLNWGVRIASCLFGFYLFRQSAARRMRAMKDDSTDDDRYRTELERRGGPSRVAVVLVGVLLLVCSFAFSAWIGPDRLMSAFYLY